VHGMLGVIAHAVKTVGRAMAWQGRGGDWASLLSPRLAEVLRVIIARSPASAEAIL